MKVQRRDGSAERLILTSMIVDAKTLAKVAPAWNEPGRLSSTWANIIGTWAVDYYNKYGKAPKARIQTLFDRWSESNPPEEQVSLVEKFLVSLSEDYKHLAAKSDSEYVTDLAFKHFNKVRIRKLIDGLEDDLDRDDLDKADERIQVNVNSLGAKEQAYVAFFNDREALINSFERQIQVLLRYPGDAGRFLGECFHRGSLIGIMAPFKRFKSYMAQDIAWRAVQQRRKVAYFQLGDLTLDEQLWRLSSRAAMAPMKAQTVLYPKKLKVFANDDYVVTYRERVFEEDLDWRKVWNANQQSIRLKFRTDEDMIRVVAHPMKSIHVYQIRSQLKSWIREGWIPDFIVADYPELLAGPPGIKDTIDQIGTTWAILKGFTQEFNCCVIAPSQVKAGAHKSWLLGRDHFQGNQLKLGHVNGMLGLNMKDNEKREGVMRMNWIVLRGQPYDEEEYCWAATCIPFSMPVVRSYLPRLHREG